MKNKKRIPPWCPGCGAYAVSAALKLALQDLKIKNKDVVVSYDIGCSGNMVNVLNYCSVATLHGRSVAFACGVAATAAQLTVIAQSGDGALLNEGLNHFVHAIQRNDPITVIANNNHVFALTAGQQSSATPKGVQARAAQAVSQAQPISIVDLAATLGAGFIARTHEDDVAKMKDIFKKAINYGGFAIVEVIQPCKIWAKNFPVKEYKILHRPSADRLLLVGRNDLLGVLYSSDVLRKAKKRSND